MSDRINSCWITSFVFQLSDTSWLTKLKVKLPILMDPPTCKGRFQFFPPKAIKEIGSYPLGICLKPRPCVDLAVEMPKVR